MSKYQTDWQTKLFTNSIESTQKIDFIHVMIAPTRNSTQFVSVSIFFFKSNQIQRIFVNRQMLSRGENEE